VAAIAKQTLGFYRDSGAAVDVDVVAVLQETLDLYSGRLESKALTVEKQFRGAHILRARRGDLYQIFANLLTNAIDASPEGGKITITVYEANAGQLNIDVQDQGSGIPAEIASRLFEPFFTTKKDIGTGLGLWVSRRLAEQLGGTINFTNVNSHHGACFQVALPLNTGALRQSAN
jgi:signal transduction histidine kinase